MNNKTFTKVWNNYLVKAVESVLKFITVLSLLFLTLSLIAMVEAWSISGIPLAVFIACLAWLGLIGIYIYIVNK